MQPAPMRVYLSLGHARWVEIGYLPVELDVSSPEKLQLGFSRQGLAEILRATAAAVEAGNWSPVPPEKERPT